MVNTDQEKERHVRRSYVRDQPVTYPVTRHPNQRVGGSNNKSKVPGDRGQVHQPTSKEQQNFSKRTPSWVASGAWSPPAIAQGWRHCQHKSVSYLNRDTVQSFSLRYFFRTLTETLPSLHLPLYHTDNYE
jgi:hypothetical protein